MTGRPSPLPYDGANLTRRAQLGVAGCQEGPEWDSQRATRYWFNTLGFRGPEFDPDAAFTVFVFGESDVFGLGIDFEEIWATRVALHIAAEHGHAADAVCVMNFAEPGASNPAIARLVLSQCAQSPPDLVLVDFAAPDRTEGYVTDRTFHVGPWVHNASVEADARQLSEADGERARYLDYLRRARAYDVFQSDAQGRLESLRSILLVQGFLAQRGIEAFATSRRTAGLLSPDVFADPVLGPLARLVDRRFVLPVSIDTVCEDPDMSEEPMHYAPVVHEALATAVLAEREAPSVERSQPDAALNRAAAVRAFYDAMPFNYHVHLQDTAQAVRSRQVEHSYPDLHALLASGAVRTVLEVGCGTGWLTADLASHYEVEVTAIDFSASALACARELVTHLGVADRVRFVEADLMTLHGLDAADLVVSIGVLHHIDSDDAFGRCYAFAGEHKRVYAGVYHTTGRAAMFEWFRERETGDDSGSTFARFAAMLSDRCADQTFLQSWYRDQFEHPHERTFDLHDVFAMLDDKQLTLRSTSINEFAPIEGREELFALERAYPDRVRAGLDAGRFLPGFFTVFATR